MSTSIPVPTHLPTEFRGCAWDDHWEFERPCVIYYPAHLAAFDSGGSSWHLESMVEEIAIDLGQGWEHNDGGLAHECEWRGWSKAGFARRRDADHIVFKVEWERDDEPGDETPRWLPTIVSKTLTKGPPP